MVMQVWGGGVGAGWWCGRGAVTAAVSQQMSETRNNFPRRLFVTLPCRSLVGETRDNINERVKAEWEDDTTPFERVCEVVERTHDGCQLAVRPPPEHPLSAGAVPPAAGRCHGGGRTVVCGGDRGVARDACGTRDVADGVRGWRPGAVELWVRSSVGGSCCPA